MRLVRVILNGIVRQWEQEFESNLPPARTAMFYATLHDIYHHYQRGDHERSFAAASHLAYAFSGEPGASSIAQNVQSLFTVLAAEFIETQTEDIEPLHQYGEIKNNDHLLILNRETAAFQYAFGTLEQQVLVGAVNAAGEQYFESGFVYRKPMRAHALVFRNGGAVDSLERCSGQRIYESTVEEGLVYRVEQLLLP